MEALRTALEMEDVTNSIVLGEAAVKDLGESVSNYTNMKSTGARVWQHKHSQAKKLLGAIQDAIKANGSTLVSYNPYDS